MNALNDAFARRHGGSPRALRKPAPPWGPRLEQEKALHDVELALAGNPASEPLQFLRAAALAELGREEESRQAYLGLLRQQPDHLGALCNLGRQLARSGHRGAARLLLERAVERHPHDLASRVNLGTLLYQCDELERARQAFERALELSPESPQAHAGMSFVMDKLGDKVGAARHRQRGFSTNAIVTLPYRGDRAPISVLLLGSTNQGNMPFERFLDDRVFQTHVVAPEFVDDQLHLPEHDLIVNAVGDVDAAPAALRAVRHFLRRTTAPVLNAPGAVRASGRRDNWLRLARLAGVRTPRSVLLPREVLAAASAPAHLAAHGLDFPLLVRSPGHHTGEFFVRVEEPAQLAAALAGLPGSELLAFEFLDTRGADGAFRKFRVMMVDGDILPLHLAISDHWKVHYFSADMADNPGHRREEQQFLEDMPGVLGARALHALRQVQQMLGLDYGGIDFALDAAGHVVVFEANATMIVVAPGGDPRWDYRRPAVERIDCAVRHMLLARTGQAPLADTAAARRGARASAAQRLGANELNFSAGPGALPGPVLEQTRQAILALPETGMSVLGMSHRTAWFEQLLEEVEANLRSLLGIPASHAIVFLQGGSSLQFSMIPMNFAADPGGVPAHVRSGYWSARAIDEAQCVRPLHIAWDGAPGSYRTLPREHVLDPGPGAAYLHYVSNETVEGLQFVDPPRAPAGIPLIADMSSDFLSRPIDCTRHAMIYAHAQKNLGPSGVTVCVIDRSLLERVPAGLPPMLDYRTHVRHRSNYNTPPVFGIFVITLVTRWVRDTVGGIEAMARTNDAKAACLYGALDQLAEQVDAHALPTARSSVNASFRFREPGLDARFLAEAAAAGFSGLEGHRSLGGIRASLYNATRLEAVENLRDFLLDFARRRG